jgi:hypothetical protein
MSATSMRLAETPGVVSTSLASRGAVAFIYGTEPTGYNGALFVFKTIRVEGYRSKGNMSLSCFHGGRLVGWKPSPALATERRTDPWAAVQ